MNRKQIALLTSFSILTSISLTSINSSIHPRTHLIKATNKKNVSKKKSAYPDIMKKLDLTSMQQYDSNTLFMKVALKDFYIKDFSEISTNKYRLLLTPLDTSDQYFITTVSMTEPLKRNHQITIQGFLNGKTKVKDKDNLQDKYLNKNTVSVLTDHVIY
jgi:hypothetical protein